MKNYMLIVKDYVGSSVNLFLQWILRYFCLNDLNIDSENNCTSWLKTFT